MTDQLKLLIERAKSVPMSNAEREEQRRSFAYGNTTIENGQITRELVDQEAERLRSK